VPSLGWNEEKRRAHSSLPAGVGLPGAAAAALSRRDAPRSWASRPASALPGLINVTPWRVFLDSGIAARSAVSGDLAVSTDAGPFVGLRGASSLGLAASSALGDVVEGPAWPDRSPVGGGAGFVSGPTAALCLTTPALDRPSNGTSHPDARPTRIPTVKLATTMASAARVRRRSTCSAACCAKPVLSMRPSELLRPGATATARHRFQVAASIHAARSKIGGREPKLLSCWLWSARGRARSWDCAR
jgi:hypothetical protein